MIFVGFEAFIPGVSVNFLFTPLFCHTLKSNLRLLMKKMYLPLFVLILFGIDPGGNCEVAHTEIESRVPVHRDIFISIKVS